MTSRRHFVRATWDRKMVEMQAWEIYVLELPVVSPNKFPGAKFPQILY